MILWITSNIGTVVAAFIIVAIIAAALVKIIKDKKKGRSSCGCGCSHCPMAGSCHKSQ